MKPEEAFNMIDKILADFKGSRTDHQLILQALEVIKGELFTPDSGK